MIVMTIIGFFTAINYFLNHTLGFLYLNIFGSENTQFPGHPWIFSLGHGGWVDRAYIDSLV